MPRSIYLALLFLVVAVPCICCDAPPTKEEQRFMELINVERVAEKLPILVLDPVLTKAARAHSAEMADKEYFDHVSPVAAHKTCMDRYLEALGHRPTYALVGENLLWESRVDCDYGHRALMASVPHKDNILDPRFESVGVGVTIDKKGQLWVTEMFLKVREVPERKDHD